MRYTHNYMSLYDADTHGDEDSAEFYTARFELEAADDLVGLRADDVGGIILYYDANDEEAAFFDYENLVGNITKHTGRRSDEV